MAAVKGRSARSSKPRPSSPQEIAPGVFLGGWKDAEKFEGERVCVLDDRPEPMPAGQHVPIYDGEGDRPIVANLDRVAAAIRSAHGSGRRVLVYCGHGVRRSPLAAAWYLHRYEDLTLSEAYDRLQALRPQVERVEEWVGHVEGLDEAPALPRPSRTRS